MKPEPGHIQTGGNLPQGGKRMTIDPAFMAHIIKILIKQYADRETAVLRELSTNARDSHVMAGRASVPIEVQTPSALSPYLVIRDYGLGLSEDEVYELFGGLGASTKRETNDATGMLGIGSKSPLAYTNQFTMTCVKDGESVVVAITKDDDGVGRLNPVHKAPTNEHNGVEIKIPVRTGNQFDAKAKQFFQYWKENTVLLNGKDPSGLTGDAMVVAPGIYMRKGDRYNGQTSMVVMGNVPYPAPTLTNTALGLPHGYYVIAYVPIGTVGFAPSREALDDEKKTMDALARIAVDFKAGLDGAIQRDIEKAPSAFEALRKMHTWRDLYYARNTPDFLYRGKPLPWEFKVPTKSVKNAWGGQTTVSAQKMMVMDRWHDGYRSRGRSADRLLSLNLTNILESVFILGYDPEKVTPTHRKKATQWLDNHTSTDLSGIKRFVLLDYKPEGLDLIPANRVVKWETIKAEKLPKATTTWSSGRIPGSYDVVYGGEKNRQGSGRYTYARTEFGVPGDKLDQSKPLYYIWGNTHDATNNVLPVMDTFHTDYTVICLPQNRLNKFKRDQPQIKDAEAVIDAKAKEIAKKMTEDERQALYMYDMRWTGRYADLDPAEVLDPDLKALALVARVDLTAVKHARERFQGRVSFQIEKFKDVLVERYPLYRAIGGGHAIRYLNAEYRYREAEARKTAANQPKKSGHSVI